MADSEPGVAPDSSRAPLLVFADDWGRHPSSCQHLVRELLAQRQTFWVNTIGTRAPRLNWSTVRRGLAKVRQWARPRAGGEDWPGNLRVLNPRMWPRFRTSIDRSINRRLLTRQLGSVLDALPEKPVAITTVPVVADVIGELAVRKWVYYCVDDFSQWPGLDQATMGRMERDLLDRVDDVVAVSPNLQARLGTLGREAGLLTHGVDLAFWMEPRRRPEGIDRLASPLVVFFGLIDRRLDLEFLNRLGELLSAGTILLVGPQADPDPALFSVPRVTVWPAVPYGDLPGLAQAADVLIMPYADLPVTRAMQPLKLKEYLATGKPAVVRVLPATREWSDCLDIAGDAHDFARKVADRLATGLPDAQRRNRLRLQSESWSQKAHQFDRVISEGGRDE